jgi:hypothetical protein
VLPGIRNQKPPLRLLGATWSCNGLPVELASLTPLNTPPSRALSSLGYAAIGGFPGAPGVSLNTPAWFCGFALKAGGPAIERRAHGQVSVFGVLGRRKNDTFCGPWEHLALETRLAIALNGLLG